MSAFPWSVPFVVNAPNGVTDTRRGKIRPLEGITSHMFTQPLMTCDSARDLGLVVPPGFREMQRWASKNDLRSLAAPRPKPPRAVATRHTQRSVALTTPFGSSQDLIISASSYQPKWKANIEDRVLHHLRPGTSTAAPRLSASASAPALPWPALGSDPLSFCSSLDRPFAGSERPELALRKSTTYLDYCAPRHGRAPPAWNLAHKGSTGSIGGEGEDGGGEGGGIGDRRIGTASRPASRLEHHPRASARPHTSGSMGGTMDGLGSFAGSFGGGGGSVLDYYGLGYRHLVDPTNIKVGHGGMKQTTWNRGDRITAGEAVAGRAWGKIVDRVDRETRKDSEW